MPDNTTATGNPKDERQTLRSLKIKATKWRMEKKHHRIQNERKIARQLRLEHHNRMKEIPFDCVVCGFQTDTLLKFLQHIKNDHYTRNVELADRGNTSILSETTVNIDARSTSTGSVTEVNGSTSKEVGFSHGETKCGTNEDTSLDNITSKPCLDRSFHSSQGNTSSNNPDESNAGLSAESEKHDELHKSFQTNSSKDINSNEKTRSDTGKTSSPIIVPGSIESLSQASNHNAKTDCSLKQSSDIRCAVKQERASLDTNLGLQILSTVSLSTGETNQPQCNKQGSESEKEATKSLLQVNDSPKTYPALKPGKISPTRPPPKKRKCSTTSRLESIVQSLKTEHSQNTDDKKSNADIQDGGIELQVERLGTSDTNSSQTDTNTVDAATSRISPLPVSTSSHPKWPRCSSPVFAVPYSNLSGEGIVTMQSNVAHDERCHPVHIFMLLGSYFQFPYPQPEELLYLSQRTRLDLVFIKQWFVKKRLKHGISWSPDEVLNAWAFITERHLPANNGPTRFYIDRLDHCQSLNQCDVKMTAGIELEDSAISRHGVTASTNGYMTINCTCSNVHLIGAVQHEVLTSVRHTVKRQGLKPGDSKIGFIANMTCLKECAVITFFSDIML